MTTRVIAAVGIRACDIFIHNGATYRAIRDAAKVDRTEVRIACTNMPDANRHLELIIHKGARLAVATDEKLQEEIDTLQELEIVLVKSKLSPQYLRHRNAITGLSVEQIRADLDTELRDVRAKLKSAKAAM